MKGSVWPVRKLVDVCEKVSVGHVGPTTEFFCAPEVGVPLVRSQNVRPGRLRLKESAYVTDTFHQTHRNSQLQAGDILIVRVGANRGDVCAVPAGVGPINCANIVFARPVDKSGFLSYYFRSEEARALLIAGTTGSAQGVINTGTIANLTVPDPPESTKHQIVAILAAYDDLIENCERRIRILDEMARKLYREWFVHFRYPGHETVPLVDSALGKIPKGWTAGTVGDFFDTSSGGTPSRKVPEYFGGPHQWVKTQELQDRFVLSTQETITDAAIARSSAKLFPARTILVAMYGATIGQLGILAAPAATNQACCSLVAKSGVADFGYVYLFMQEQKQQLIHLATGAAQPNVSQQVIRRLELVKPSAEVQILFRNIITPKYELVLQIQQVADNLRRTRDLLLPRLLSGQLDVGAMA